MGIVLETKCNECGKTIRLNLGDATYEEAMEMIDKFDKKTYECTGFHVEMGGWKKMWNLEEAVNDAYSKKEKELV